MANAFYLPEEDWTAQPVLKGQEAKHLSQVLRMKCGEHILIFNGQGKKAECEITEISKREVKLHILNEHLTPRPTSLAIMALAQSKATRRGFFMEKAVELGVHEVWLWAGEHSQGRIQENLKEHWHGQCIAAMKQCHNPWLPEIHILKGGVKELVERSAHIDNKFLPWEVQENVPMLQAELIAKEGISIYTIGPEGGFSKNEVTNLKDAGFMPVSLGNRVLRCETAALLCLGLHWWKAQTI